MDDGRVAAELDLDDDAEKEGAEAVDADTDVDGNNAPVLSLSAMLAEASGSAGGSGGDGLGAENLLVGDSSQLVSLVKLVAASEGGLQMAGDGQGGGAQSAKEGGGDGDAAEGKGGAEGGSGGGGGGAGGGDGKGGKPAFSLLSFLSSEGQLLRWKSQGLPSDKLSSENGIVILNAPQPPLIIDPSSQATSWLKTYLQAQDVPL